MKIRLLVLPVVLAVSLIPATAATAAVSDPIDPAFPTAVASWGTNRLDLFAKGTDGTLKHKIYNGRWSSWESLGGAITSGPAAVSWGHGRLDVVARSTSGGVVHRSYSNGTWSGWTSLGGVITGEPAISSWGANRLDVVVRGGGNAIYHKAYNGTAWSSSWSNLGGVLSSSPAIESWGTNRIDVFARGGSANSLYHKWWNGKWSAWENLGGSLTSAPAVTSGSSGYLQVFARVAANAISIKSYGPTGWTLWTNLGGTFTTAPGAVASNPSTTDVFARGSDTLLNRRTWQGFFGWTSWSTLPDAATTTPVAPYTRTMAVQASPAAGALIGPLAYSYVDNIGRIVSGHQPDPANTFSVQWTVISGNEAFSGPPALIEQPDKRLQVSALHTGGDIWAKVQTAQAAATWKDWVNQGGSMAGAVTTARQTDGSVVLLALDAAGALWYMSQSNVGGSYQTWANLGITGLVGLPAVVAVRDGLQLFALDTTGAMRTATLFPAGTVTAWTSLGGAGLTGSPAAVVYPGYRMRVFVQAADGTIVTKVQDDAMAWPAEWSPVGFQVAGGSPSAVLSPQSGKTELVVRGTDGNVYSTGETLQGSGVWRDWVPVLQGADVTATDPTVLSYNDGVGFRWAFLFRTADQQSRMYTVETSVFSLNATGSAAGAGVETGAAPTFRANILPSPPES